MPGMSQVIYNNGVRQGKEEGKNELVMVIQRLRNGERGKSCWKPEQTSIRWSWRKAL